MGDVEKALQAIAKAIENQTAVQSVKVTITIKKPKASKATTKDDT